jgi:uncharacterized oligopeptide transporter (OPT) family protein
MRTSTIFAIAAVLLVAVSAVAAEGEDYLYGRADTAGPTLGAGVGLALPTPILIVILLAFLAFVGLLVRAILKNEEEKAAPKKSKKDKKNKKRS